MIYDLKILGDNLTEKFNALLTFLTAMGIIVDPTTLKVFLIVNKQWIMIHRDNPPLPFSLLRKVI
ncbi:MULTISPECIES: phage holin [Bacillus]|uniref:phage holin n=1 Tax=Bacillus sp. B28 TaxID=1167886 RepID=UPI0020C80D02|nr:MULTISPECIES: phage holin [Bacillus]UZD49692.1 phage holin family protein [Bacillus halotolerans]WEY43351.1 phage holin [Bacillus sp. B28]